MSSKPEPAIWPRDTVQRILCFAWCQLIIAWTANIKEVHSKPRLSLVTYCLEYGRHVARLRRRRAYAPTSNTACHDNHDKINSWVSFAFLYVFEYGAPLGGPSGRRSSAMITKLFPKNDKLNQSSETCAAHIAKADHACEISNVCQITIFYLYFNETSSSTYIVWLYCGFPVLDYITQSLSYTP